jgi:hypothetical protein
MGIKTGKIKYNVHERGRQHHGAERRFDTAALARLVNSPAVQERVKNRDLHGYYGHLIRMKYGMRPPEWIMDGGEQIYIEPALVTTYLYAEPDGTITHESEFLDTVPGQTAARLFASKAGGFSSAIKAEPSRAGSVATQFNGFDYVLEPNYTTNRGYLLDGVMFDSTSPEMADAILDSAIAEQAEQARAFMAIFDSLQADHILAMQTLERLREENEEMLSMLAARGGDQTVILDSTGHAPVLTGGRATREFESRIRAFQTGTLTQFETPPEEKAKAEHDDALALTRRKWGIA